MKSFTQNQESGEPSGELIKTQVVQFTGLMVTRWQTGRFGAETLPILRTL
ncbi:hypothetical protein [Hymenobacter sp.]|nr:hypothetical protein [Hymenobacter sp.]